MDDGCQDWLEGRRGESGGGRASGPIALSPERLWTWGWVPGSQEPRVMPQVQASAPRGGGQTHPDAWGQPSSSAERISGHTLMPKLPGI